MLRTRTLAQSIATQHGAAATSVHRTESEEDGPLARPVISAPLLHHVFDDTGGLPMLARKVMQNATDESMNAQELPLPRAFEYIQTVGQLLPPLTNAKYKSAIRQHLSEASDTRDAEREFKLRRMDRDAKQYNLALHQIASCALDAQESAPHLLPGERTWGDYRSGDVYDDEGDESERPAPIDLSGGHEEEENGTTAAEEEEEEEEKSSRPSMMEQLALSGLNLGHKYPATSISAATSSTTSASASSTTSAQGDKGQRATGPPQSRAMGAAALPITITFDYWANAVKATGRSRHEFLPIEVSLIESGIKSLEGIAKLMNGKPHYNAGPLRDPETGAAVTQLQSPFVASDEMATQDAALIHTFTDFSLVNAHLPRFILWMAPGDQLTTMATGLPFLQVAPAVAKASSGLKGMRQDLIYSIGRVSIYRAERKNWNDCLQSYHSKHYHGQRATMTRCGMSNCCVDFIVEYPRNMLLDRSAAPRAGDGSQPQHLDILMQEYAMHRAIEASTLQQSGIHTRRTIHLFDTFNMILDDIRKLLEHGCAKYQSRVEHRPVCFTPDTSTSASNVLSNKGRKGDLDNRHQFVVAFHHSQMGISEKSCHALFDRYHSMAELILAYEKCDPDDRDDMLTREVQFKDATKYTLFGVVEDEETPTEANVRITGGGKRKKGAGGGATGGTASKAPFGAVTSARIHRFLYNLPPKETKPSKARANRLKGPE